MFLWWCWEWGGMAGAEPMELPTSFLTRCLCAGAGGEAAGGAAAGRRTLDFESLAFAQGGHLMANKKCDLPKGSYRTAFKARPPATYGGRRQLPPQCGAHPYAWSCGMT